MTQAQSVPVSEITNEDLLSRYFADDDTAFTEFFNRQWRGLKNRAMRMGARREVAEDLASEVLFAVARTKDRPNSRWVPSRGPVGPWLHTLLRNRFISIRRSKKGKEILDTDFGPMTQDGERMSLCDLQPARESSVESKLTKHEVTQLLQPAINRLPPQEQDIVRLKYWHDLSHKEISARIGISPATVTRRLAAASERLRSSLALSERESGSNFMPYNTSQTTGRRATAA